MRAAAVVGLENLLYEDEEIEQSSLRQGRPDRRSAVPFTENLVAHVRMDHVTV